MYCFTDYDSKKKNKWKQVKFPTIVNLLNGIYYNNIKDNHAVIKHEVVKESLRHGKECVR